MTKAEQRYLSKVAALPCALCGCEGVHIHHAREGQGMAQRAQNWLAIPLCQDCHTGPHGFHGDRQLLKARKVDEMDLLAMTIERLNT